MPYLHFKKQFVPLIQQGLKWETTRYKILWGDYTCVYGSRYKPIKFAIIHIKLAKRTTWREVIDNHYNPEGFSSPAEFAKFLIKEKLIKKNIKDVVYNHVFSLVK